jgi:hypothetical protein
LSKSPARYSSLGWRLDFARHENETTMISRIWLRCLTCSKPVTARVQVGHEFEQR